MTCDLLDLFGKLTALLLVRTRYLAVVKRSRTFRLIEVITPRLRHYESIVKTITDGTKHDYPNLHGASYISHVTHHWHGQKKKPFQNRVATITRIYWDCKEP